MPLYDYECDCGHSFEMFNSIPEREHTICPECHKVAKQVLTPPRLDIFKPFWAEHLTTKPVYVESKDHWAHLCRTANPNGPVKNPIVHGGYKEYGKQKREI